MSNTLMGLMGGGGDVLSPGQPTGGGGGVGGKKSGKGNLAALASPLLAILASKMSGGELNFADAMAHLGRGFVETKSQQLHQRRQQGFDQENRTIEVAHRAVQNLNKLNPNTMAKYPRLQELANKYQQALMDDGQISPKEAGEIVQLYTVAQNDVSAAEQSQAFDTKQTEQKQGEQLQTEALSRALGQQESAPTFEGPPQSQEQLMGSANRMRSHSLLAQFAHDTPVETPYGFLKPTEHASFIRADTQAQAADARDRRAEAASKRADRALQIREGINARSIQRQEATAQYSADLQEWRMELEAAKSEAGKYGWDPEALREFEAANPRPRPEDYGLAGRQGTKRTPAKPQTGGATHRFNPATGQIEPIK